MPRKHIIHKQTKRAKNIRAAIAAKKARLASVSCSNNNSAEESSENIFDRLLEQSRNDDRFASTSQHDFEDPKRGYYTDQMSYENDNSEESDDPDYNLQPLVIEKCNVTIADDNCTVEGRRVVDLVHILSEMERLATHPLKCTMGKYKLKREVKNGLFSRWIFFCDNCEKECTSYSIPVLEKEDINDAVAWGAMSIGIGHAQLEEFFSVLNVPMMNHNKYRSHEIKIGKTWEETLVRKMKENAEAEKRIAIEKGNFLHGVPYITVIGDGGWAKRSYGHGMNSLSGVGVLIGSETKKLLYMGVRNKFCFACSNPNKKNEDHLCFKNYNGPSTGMESSVIVEGFRRSEDDYGLYYLHYIGDGDSSVYARIQEGCRYGRYVKKIECANHVTRALNDNLHKIAANTRYPLASRQLLTNPAQSGSICRLERIVKGVRTAIKEAGVTKSAKEVLNLRHDIRNAPDHVFGNHSKCRDFCKRKSLGEANVISEIDKGFLAKIRTLINNVESKAESLVFNETTNFAEKYMGCVAKFSGGKRINFSSGGSFGRRCLGAGLAHSAGPSWHLSPWKSFKHRSPGSIFRKRILRRERMHFKRKELYATKKANKDKIMKRKRREGGYDAEYGPLAVEPDIEESVMEVKKKEFLETLANDVLDGNEQLSEVTKGQHKNELWKEKRMNRLTASKFGDVAKRLPYTPCHNMVKTILYPKALNTEPITFGRDNEDNVLKLYEEMTSKCVKKCGLFVDVEHPYLGASPDGLVDNDGLIEVKCLFSVQENDLLEEVKRKKKDICLEAVEGGDTLRLKRSHKYYYQIQGQLNICKKEWCDLVVYTKKGEVFVERISRDETFWEDKILPKLVQFYIECMLPEIIDSRIVRGFKVRDPNFILEAQDRRKIKQVKKKPVNVA